MNRKIIIIGSFSVALAAPCVWAHDEGDILFIIEGGQLVTNFLSTDGHVFVANTPVLPAAFEHETDALHAHHPGWLADAGTFGPGASIGFNIVAPLKIWIGGGYDPIDPLTGSVLSIEHDAMSATTADGFVPGFSVLAAADGSLNSPFEHVLESLSESEPAAGVYLLEIEIDTDMPGVLGTGSRWIVFNNGMNELTFETAFGYVFDFIVPAPGGLAAVLMLVPIRHRRRRA